MPLKRPHSDTLSSEHTGPFSHDSVCSMQSKLVHLDASSAISSQPALMRCSLAPHEPGLTFTSYDDYEVHYLKSHMNRCTECQKNFPDQHFLGLHIAENHDPIRATKRERGEKTFACLVAGCDRVCSTPHKRRLHCIDKHLFPRNYDFFIVNDGIDGRSSMLRLPHRRRSSTVNSTTSTIDQLSAHGTKPGVSSLARDDGICDGIDMEDDMDLKLHARSPLRLHGRGGFGHPSSRHGSGHGHGHDHDQTHSKTLPVPNEATAETTRSNMKSDQTEALDPIDSLASSMSALRFVPHSLYARGRGRGRGG